MKIENIHIKNYRCFSDLKVNFDAQLTVLVGVNGSGKTTILDALAIFLDLFSRNIFIQAGSFAHTNVSSANLKLGAESISLSYGIIDESLPSTLDQGNYADFAFSFQKRLQSENSLVLTTRSDIIPAMNILRKNASSFLCPLPIIVYYTSKRVLNAYDANKQAQAERNHIFDNAFKPQIDFSSSLAWFIAKASQEALEAKRLNDLTHVIPELSAVRQGISKALGEFGEPYVGETPPKLFISPKDNLEQAFQIEQLSDGYRTMLALVMDLARRMAVANGQVIWSEDQTVLHSPGVVLIDEVELHLHPSWQQTVLPNLMEIFPNVQFIVTTHSPQVLTSIEPQHIRILEDGKVLPTDIGSFGAQSWRVLEDILGVRSRPQTESAKVLDIYFALINEGKGNTDAALEFRQKLEKWLADDPALTKADMLIARQERLWAKKLEATDA